MNPQLSNTAFHPTIRNLVVQAELGAKLDLLKIARNTWNVEYKYKPGSGIRENALIWKTRNPKTTAKVYGSGKIIVFNAKTMIEAEKAIKKFANILRKQKMKVQVKNLRLRYANVSINISKRIRLAALAITFHRFCWFEPELFPGLLFKLPEPECKIWIFTNGRMRIQGLKDIRESKTAFKKILDINVCCPLNEVPAELVATFWWFLDPLQLETASLVCRGFRDNIKTCRIAGQTPRHIVSVSYGIEANFGREWGTLIGTWRQGLQEFVGAPHTVAIEYNQFPEEIRAKMRRMFTANHVSEIWLNGDIDLTLNIVQHLIRNLTYTVSGGVSGRRRIVKTPRTLRLTGLRILNYPSLFQLISNINPTNLIIEQLHMNSFELLQTITNPTLHQVPRIYVDAQPMATPLSMNTEELFHLLRNRFNARQSWPEKDDLDISYLVIRDQPMEQIEEDFFVRVAALFSREEDLFPHRLVIKKTNLVLQPNLIAGVWQDNPRLHILSYAGKRFRQVMEIYSGRQRLTILWSLRKVRIEKLQCLILVNDHHRTPRVNPETIRVNTMGGKFGRLR